MPRALIVVDAARRVLGCNARARALIDAGSPILESGGRLGFVDASADARFADELQALLEADGGTPAGCGPTAGFVCSGRAPGADAMMVRLTPMADAVEAPSGAASPPQPCALMELTRLSDGAPAQAPDSDLVALAWGLTRAQARVAVAIASGRTPSEVARDFGVTIRTVRSHLSSVYQALGIQGQVELARRLCAHPVLSSGGDGTEIVAIGRAGTLPRRRGSA